MVEGSVRDGPARREPAIDVWPALVIEMAPALASFAAELTIDPFSWEKVLPTLNVMSPPAAGLPPLVFALEINAPARIPDVPCSVTLPPTMNEMLPPFPALVRFSAKIWLPALRTTFPLTTYCIGQALFAPAPS